MANSTTKMPAATNLPDAVFATPTDNHQLLKQAYLAYLASARRAQPHAKQRGEVRGGGKKPWRQKGTGRARVGSSRNPIWRGGGVVFGPQGNENHVIKLSVKSKRLAVRQALTIAKNDGKINVRDIKATGKTGDMVKALNGDGSLRHILFVVDEKTPEILRSTSNLGNVTVLRATYLDVYHILNADRIIILPSALPLISEWLIGREDKVK